MYNTPHNGSLFGELLLLYLARRRPAAYGSVSAANGRDPLRHQRDPHQHGEHDHHGDHAGASWHRPDDPPEHDRLGDSEQRKRAERDEHARQSQRFAYRGAP